jgi:hypothetical protein
MRLYRPTLLEAARQRIALLEKELKQINQALNDPRVDLTLTTAEVILDMKKQLAIKEAEHLTTRV